MKLGIVITSVLPEPATLSQPSPTPRLPPLLLQSHLSVFTLISHQGEVTEDYLIADLLPVTPDALALFRKRDQFSNGLGIDMGLTDPHLPLAGTAEWPLAVQAYYDCPDATGLHRTTDVRVRLDFSTSRFRLGAEFTGTNLQAAGLDLHLYRPSLLNRQSQQATTELSFFTDIRCGLRGSFISTSAAERQFISAASSAQFLHLWACQIFCL